MPPAKVSFYHAPLQDGKNLTSTHMSDGLNNR